MGISAKRTVGFLSTPNAMLLGSPNVPLLIGNECARFSTCHFHILRIPSAGRGQPSPVVLKCMSLYSNSIILAISSGGFEGGVLGWHSSVLQCT